MVAPYHRIANHVLQEHGPAIGPYGYAVLGVLSMYLKPGNQVVWPAVGTIAETIGISRRRVGQALKTLEERGLISIESRRGEQSKYTLTCAPDAQGCAADARVPAQHVRGVAQHVRTNNNQSQEPGEQEPIPREGLPKNLDVDAFKSVWNDWKTYTREKTGRPIAPSTARAQVEQFSGWGPERAIATIKHTIRQGYVGLVEPTTTTGGPTSDRPPRRQSRRCTTQPPADAT